MSNTTPAEGRYTANGMPHGSTSLTPHVVVTPAERNDTPAPATPQPPSPLPEPLCRFGDSEHVGVRMPVKPEPADDQAKMINRHQLAPPLTLDRRARSHRQRQ